MPPLVSVLTAVRNGARFLPEAIASIRAQTMTDWEYVIVDDASEDDTVALIEREAQADPRIRLIRRSSAGGPYVAANEGLATAGGRYIARIDADDVAAPSRLEAQLRFLSEHPDLRACAGFHRVMSPDGGLSRGVRVPLLPGVLRWRLCASVDPVHSSAFIERSALEELGGYRPLPLAQDWRLWCELSRRDWLGVVPEVVVFRRVHADRLTVREGPMQTHFALDVAREHIRCLSGEEWPADDVEMLRHVVHARVVPLRSGWRVLGRWVELWKADLSLSREERADLRWWTRVVKLRYVRSWSEALPFVGRGVRLAGLANITARQAVVRSTGALRLRRTTDPERYSQAARRSSSGSGSSR